MKKILYILMTLVGAALLFNSCVNDEKSIYDGFQQERIAEYLLDFEEVLIKEPNGWHMAYYTSSDAADRAGCFNLALNFTEGGFVTFIGDYDANAIVAGTPVTSEYTLKSDFGPILSFSTYNPYFHYFAEYQNSYFTYEGDFEFMIMEYTKDEIVLKGKKTGQYFYMTPWKLGEQEEYLQNVADFYGRTSALRLDVYYNGAQVAHANNDLLTRKLTFNVYYSFDEWGNPTEYTYTYANPLYNENGMTFPKNERLLNVRIPDMVWDEDDEVFVSTDPKIDMVFKPVIPEGVVPYDDYPGNYIMTYNTNYSGTSERVQREVELVQKVRNQSFILKNAFDIFDVEVNYMYDNGGKLRIVPQKMDHYMTNDIGEEIFLWLMMLTTTDRFWNSSALSIDSELISSDPMEFDMVDNGSYSGSVIAGLYFRYKDASDQNYLGQYEGQNRVFTYLNFRKID